MPVELSPELLAAYGEALARRSSSIVMTGGWVIGVEQVEDQFKRSGAPTPVYVDRIAGINRLNSKGYDDDKHLDDKMRDATLAGMTFIAYLRTNYGPASRDLNDENWVFDNPLSEDEVARFLLQRLVDLSLEGRWRCAKHLKKTEVDLPPGTRSRDLAGLQHVSINGIPDRTPSSGGTMMLKDQVWSRSSRLDGILAIAGDARNGLAVLDDDSLLDMHEFLSEELRRLAHAEKYGQIDPEHAPASLPGGIDFPRARRDLNEKLAPLIEWEDSVVQQANSKGANFRRVSHDDPGGSTIEHSTWTGMTINREGADAYVSRRGRGAAAAIAGTTALMAGFINGVGIVASAVLGVVGAGASQVMGHRMERPRVEQVRRNYEELRKLRERQHFLEVDAAQCAAQIESEQKLAHDLRVVIEEAYAYPVAAALEAKAQAMSQAVRLAEVDTVEVTPQDLVYETVGLPPIESPRWAEWAHFVTSAAAIRRSYDNFTNRDFPIAFEDQERFDSFRSRRFEDWRLSVEQRAAGLQNGDLELYKQGLRRGQARFGTSPKELTDGPGLEHGL